MKTNEIRTNQPKLNNGFLSVLFSLIFLVSLVSCNQSTTEGNNEAVDGTLSEEVDDDVTDTDILETEEDYFTSWDTNTDEMWDDSEFETGIGETGLFNDWDVNDDGLFDDDELGDGIFDMYDADDDGFLNNEEYSTWNTAWDGELEQDMDAWDVTDDNQLDDEEYYTGINDNGIFDEWDNDDDGLFSEDEVNDGLFSTWDDDDDGLLTDSEYEGIGYNDWRM